MMGRTSKGGAAAPRNRTSAARGRSAFVLQSDEVRRRSGEGPPSLPVRVVTVKPSPGALVYTDAGFPLPDDQWSQVPISPGIVQALKYGDLEEAEAAPPGEGEGGTEGSENPTGRRSPPEGRRNRAETEPEKPTVQ